MLGSERIPGLKDNAGSITERYLKPSQIHEQ